MLPFDPISAVLGIAKTTVGLINSGQTKREAGRLEKSRPKLRNSRYVKDQLSLAESELQEGISAETENAYEQGIDRSLSNSLDSLLKSGGSVNNIAELFDASQQGRQRFALMSENIRMNQINQLVQAQSVAEHERQQQFQFSEWAPWADKTQANAKARQGAQDQIWSGLETVGSSFMFGLGGAQGEQDFNNYFDNPSSPYAGGGVRGVQVAAPGMSYSMPSPAMNYGSLNPNFNNSPARRTMQINPNYAYGGGY